MKSTRLRSSKPGLIACVIKPPAIKGFRCKICAAYAPKSPASVLHCAQILENCPVDCTLRLLVLVFARECVANPCEDQLVIRSAECAARLGAAMGEGARRRVGAVAVGNCVGTVLV